MCFFFSSVVGLYVCLFWWLGVVCDSGGSGGGGGGSGNFVVSFGWVCLMVVWWRFCFRW